MASFFGSDDGDDSLQRIADRLDVPADEQRILDRLDDLDESINTVVSAADLHRRGFRSAPAPDASPVEKVGALAQALNDDVVSLASSDGDASGSIGRGEGELSSIAGDIAQSRAPSDQTARKLLDELAAPGGPEAIRDVLVDTIERLERYQSLEESLTSTDDIVRNPRNTQREVERADDGPVADVVVNLIETLTEARDRLDTVESGRDRLAEAVDAAAEQRDIKGEDSLDRAKRLQTSLEDGRQASTEADESALLGGAAAADLDPESRIADELVEDLSDPAANPIPAVEAAVSALDRSETLRSVVAETDRDSVKALAETVQNRSESVNDPVADVVTTRASRLLSAIERASAANDAPVYAAERELRFYDKTLLDSINSRVGHNNGVAVADARELGDRVEERTTRLKHEYVDRLSDHNHSIPMHFLQLAETLTGKASEHRDSGEPEVALGFLRAVDALLDGVEELYELNEFSMMLRRLRG